MLINRRGRASKEGGSQGTKQEYKAPDGIALSLKY